jgi:hypothetical protein
VTSTSSSSSTTSTAPPPPAVVVIPTPIALRFQPEGRGLISGAGPITVKNTSQSTVSITALVPDDPEYRANRDGCGAALAGGTECKADLDLLALAPHAAPSSVTFALGGAAAVPSP